MQILSTLFCKKKKNGTFFVKYLAFCKKSSNFVPCNVLIGKIGQKCQLYNLLTNLLTL